jgi:hypothetical protein
VLPVAAVKAPPSFPPAAAARLEEDEDEPGEEECVGAGGCCRGAVGCAPAASEADLDEDDELSIAKPLLGAIDAAPKFVGSQGHGQLRSAF